MLNETVVTLKPPTKIHSGPYASLSQLRLIVHTELLVSSMRLLSSLLVNYLILGLALQGEKRQCPIRPVFVLFASPARLEERGTVRSTLENEWIKLEKKKERTEIALLFIKICRWLSQFKWDFTSSKWRKKKISALRRFYLSRASATRIGQ